MLRTTIGILALSTFVGLAAPTPLVDAQSKAKVKAAVKSESSKKKSQAKSSRSTKRPKQRLPRYYGQLELESEQRDKILAIQDRFADRIAKLRQQIAKLETERDKELQRVLKTAQKRKLKTLSDS